ncbi:MAG: RluA family pseudouridine synthase [Longicatena sp.]
MNIQMKNKTCCFSDINEASTDALFARFHIGKKTKYAYYQQGLLQINNTTIKQNMLLKKTDILTIFFREESDQVIPIHKPLTVVYEDDLFLIVDKPNNMIVHSDGINKEANLSNLVKAYYQETKQTCLVRPIHRLDYDTTGLVIFCKLTFFQPLLDAMLEEKKIERQYYALCEGIIKENKIEITGAIGKDRHHSQKMRISSTGKNASTSVYVKQRFSFYTFIECHLHTGRTHQIRVHLASIHHPLLSDSLYGKKSFHIPRLALHAYRVILFHPLLQKTLQIDCPLPPDMKKCI